MMRARMASGRESNQSSNSDERIQYSQLNDAQHYLLFQLPKSPATTNTPVTCKTRAPYRTFDFEVASQMMYPMMAIPVQKRRKGPRFCVLSEKTAVRTEKTKADAYGGTDIN